VRKGDPMTSQLRDRVGQFGVWQGAAQGTPELAAGLEQLGYGTIWLGGSPGGDLQIVQDLLAATSTLNVGTSIVNMWQDEPSAIAADFHRIEAAHPGRFVLGVGAGHREATREYASPYETLSAYVDQLLAHDVPADSLVLAALGPRVLRLAAGKTGGAIPYLVPPEHTARARAILGPELLLAPEQKVVLDADPARARELGRKRVRNPYLGLSNYTSNLRRLGFTDDDLAGDGSDRLIDALVAHGSSGQVASQLREHLDAGADHVCAQLLTRGGEDPLAGYADLAGALGLPAR
jgi:probable F420-dependent oxidoreductase